MDNTNNLTSTVVNTVYVRWFDGHFSKIEATARSVKFGSDTLSFTALAEMVTHHIPLRFVRWFSTTTESHQDPERDRSNYAKKCYVVTVEWIDGYVEEFKATEIRHGSDLLWMRLESGENRHIPLRSVRSFTTYEGIMINSDCNKELELKPQSNQNGFAPNFTSQLHRK